MSLKLLHGKQLYKKVHSSKVKEFNNQFLATPMKDYNSLKHGRLPRLPKSLFVQHPAHPIISDHGSLIENASSLIDLCHRPHISRLLLYTKNSIHLLQSRGTIFQIQHGWLQLTLNLYKSVTHILEG